MAKWLDTGAIFSDDGAYRYRLWRIWSEVEPTIAFCMLNPSTATAEIEDPTIRRCIGFAKAWGYGGLVVVNIFALRSTDPLVLYKHSDPIGPDNDAHIANVRHTVPLMIAAWGAHGNLKSRGFMVKHMVETKTLGLTSGGQPKHPLYLRGDCVPQDW